MAKQLTDKERKQIVAAYVETGNISAVSRQFNISRSGVRKILDAEGDVAEKCRLKKEENVTSVLAHMDARKRDVCELIDLLLVAINNPEKIAATPLNQLATTMGILIDKYTSNEVTQQKAGSGSLADTIMDAYAKRKEAGEE